MYVTLSGGLLTAVLDPLLIFGFGWVVFRYGIVFVEDFGGDLMETISYTNYWYYPAMPISGRSPPSSCISCARSSCASARTPITSC